MRIDLKPNMNKLKELEVGMTFQNLNELCEFVGLAKTNKTGYQILKREFALLKAGVEFERQGHKIIIVAINLKNID